MTDKEVASEMIGTISFVYKCAIEQCDMFGLEGYDREYHIKKTIAQALAMEGYRKQTNTTKEILTELADEYDEWKEKRFRDYDTFVEFCKRYGVDIREDDED